MIFSLKVCLKVNTGLPSRAECHMYMAKITAERIWFHQHNEATAHVSDRLADRELLPLKPHQPSWLVTQLNFNLVAVSLFPSEHGVV